MMHDFLSLALYTVLAQTAAGTYIFTELAGIRQNPVKKSRNIIIILILMVIAAGISFFHLGKPAHAMNAVNNIRTSWLSREILLMCILIAVLPVYSVSLARNSNLAAKVLRFTSVILALLFMYSMIMLYMLPSVRSWHHGSTPVSFFLTSAICGITLAGILHKSDADRNDNRYTILVVIFILASLINSIIYWIHINYTPDLWLYSRLVLPLCAVLILTVKKIRYFSNNSALWPVIAFGLLFTGELAGRIIFFLSFERSGL